MPERKPQLADRRDRWRLGRSIAVGAVAGGVSGLALGWMDYGHFDIRFMSNHVIGGIVLGGVAFALIAAAMNWMKRNPL